MKKILFLLAGLVCIEAWAAPNQVSGIVFQDLDGDGIYEGESGLGAAQVLLQGIDGTVYQTQTLTEADGGFVFSGLPDGTFRICAQAPSANPEWVGTTPECRRLVLDGGKNPETVVVRFGFDREVIEGCTRTQGYWGNAPAGEALLATLVGAQPGGQMLLGSIGYTATELQSILDVSVSTPGPGANALISLAHQLIAAKANRLNGASAPQSVLNAIAAADVLIGTKDMSPVGSSPQIAPSSTEGQAMDAQKTILDTYNNGQAQGGPGHCESLAIF
ncbi:MAG: carboxypeptidase-like regulatory domain-containing protein [Oligoflexia bacterium]